MNILISYYIILTILSLYYILQINSLDASFTAADDEQLPLSANYRQSLRNLCDIIDKGGKLPPSYAGKEHEIKRQCNQLKKDDNHISSSSPISNFSLSNKSILFTLLSITGALVYLNKNNPYIHQVISYVYKLFRTRPLKTSSRTTRRPSFTKVNQDNSNNNIQTTIPIYDKDAIREARMKRFANLNKDAESSTDNESQ
uniref:Uncharacterized protein n=1 Tax=Chromulina nebulosa TaxID=96789 RepID=A0A7S0SV00_9STRA|mmetsp:Transcript_3362/g.2985  ORF Transcript_3362/g.2985 Transcript_3362/m.2985 type:complete len:199 (+) Transcript_3362:42-638(+)